MGYHTLSIVMLAVGGGDIISIFYFANFSKSNITHLFVVNYYYFAPILKIIPGLERAYSGSTKTTDTSDSIDINNKALVAGEQQQPPPEDSNNSTQDSDEDDGGGRRTPPSTMSRGNSTGVAAAGGGGGMGAGTSFEASLLLGIAGTESGVILPETPQPEKERREPIDSTTLPTSMTSFLDMLTEEQRRVRHRYIPGVEGFRKLYKGEIRADMSEARRTKRTTTTVSSREVSEESLADNAMEVDQNNENKDHDVPPTEEGAGGGGGDNQSVASENAEEEEEDDNNGLPNREAFIAPTKESRKFALKGQLASLLDNTDFENSVKSGGGGGTSSFKSPHLVDSLTSFNPPRPQESTTYKTHHRLKRWEANPAEVETDLMNYRKTVSRTRTELHLAQKEHERIERVSSLMRSHFMNHLVCYKQEMMALNDGIGSVNGKCSKLDDEYNGIKELRSMATRGGQSSRTMKDFVGTLKSLGEEIEGVKQEDVDVTNKDWRVTGVGGVTAKDKKAAMGNGWLLVGDEVIVRSTGEEGVAVLVCGPEVQNKVEEEALVEDKKVKQDGAAEAKNTGGDAMDVDETPTKKEDEKKENKSPTKKESPKKKELSQVLVKPTSIKVNLAKSGKVETFLPTEVEFNPKSLPTLLLSDPKLAKRWENMVKTGLANSADHDVLAMEEYINSSLVQDKTEGDGATSPKCVGEERSLLPFGSGCVAAPEDVKNYPSVIPLDNLEETVRKVVYEAEKPRVRLLCYVSHIQ